MMVETDLSRNSRVNITNQSLNLEPQSRKLQGNVCTPKDYLRNPNQKDVSSIGNQTQKPKVPTINIDNNIATEIPLVVAFHATKDFPTFTVILDFVPLLALNLLM